MTKVVGGLGKRILRPAANGVVTDEGDVWYEDVNALRGITVYPDNEGHPIEVKLLGPDCEMLTAKRP